MYTVGVIAKYKLIRMPDGSITIVIQEGRFAVDSFGSLSPT